MVPVFDRNAIRLAQALYRLWRLRRWERQRSVRKAEEARVRALYSLPAPKYPPRPLKRASQTSLEETIRVCLSPTGQTFGIGIVERREADEFMVALTRGNHSVTTLITAEKAADAQAVFAVAGILHARLEDIATKVDAETPVRVHQTPLR